jgi:hypothetical protein
MREFQLSRIGSIMATSKKSEPASEVQVIDPDAREFRKANSAVGLRVRSGPTLTMMGRRIFNVLLYHAQHQGSTGANAPKPWDACPNPEDYYWIPSAELAHDSSWGSKDHKMLIQGLQQLQTTLVESDDPTGRFTSVQLIGTVHVLRGSGRRPTMVGWEFPRSTRDILSNPDFYTKLSIYHLTSLKTVAGTALYEMAKRYLTNIGGRTARQHWHWWHDTLTGKQVGSVKFPEFRYFKRDTLTPAIAEVNRTDIRVELVETRKGRSVTDLQFLVSYAPQASLELSPEPVVDTELVDRIKALGFTERQASELLSKYDAHFVRETLDLVQARMADRSKPPLGAPAAFMRMALKDNYVAAKPRQALNPEPDPPSQGSSKAKPVKEPSGDPQRAARVESEMARFDALGETEQNEILAQFYVAFPVARRYKRDGRPFRLSLGGWLAGRDVKEQQALAS